MPATSSDHDAVSAAVISGAVIGTTLPLLVVVVIVIMAVVLSRRRKRSRSMPDEAKLMDVPSSQQHTHSTSGQSHETKLYISTSPNSKQIGKKSEYHVLTDNESTQHELVESTSFGGTMDDEVTTDPTDNGNTDPNPSCSLSQDDQ